MENQSARDDGNQNSNTRPIVQLDFPTGILPSNNVSERNSEINNDQYNLFNTLDFPAMDGNAHRRRPKQQQQQQQRMLPQLTTNDSPPNIRGRRGRQQVLGDFLENVPSTPTSSAGDPSPGKEQAHTSSAETVREAANVEVPRAEKKCKRPLLSIPYVAEQQTRRTLITPSPSYIPQVQGQPPTQAQGQHQTWGNSKRHGKQQWTNPDFRSSPQQSAATIQQPKETPARSSQNANNLFQQKGVTNVGRKSPEHPGKLYPISTQRTGIAEHPSAASQSNRKTWHTDAHQQLRTAQSSSRVTTAAEQNLHFDSQTQLFGSQKYHDSQQPQEPQYQQRQQFQSHQRRKQEQKQGQREHYQRQQRQQYKPYQQQTQNQQRQQQQWPNQQRQNQQLFNQRQQFQQQHAENQPTSNQYRPQAASSGNLHQSRHPARLFDSANTRFLQRSGESKQFYCYTSEPLASVAHRYDRSMEDEHNYCGNADTEQSLQAAPATRPTTLAKSWADDMPLDALKQTVSTGTVTRSHEIAEQLPPSLGAGIDIIVDVQVVDEQPQGDGDNLENEAQQIVQTSGGDGNNTAWLSQTGAGDAVTDNINVSNGPNIPLGVPQSKVYERDTQQHLPSGYASSYPSSYLHPDDMARERNENAKRAASLAVHNCSPMMSTSITNELITPQQFSLASTSQLNTNVPEFQPASSSRVATELNLNALEFYPQAICFPPEDPVSVTMRRRRQRFNRSLRSSTLFELLEWPQGEGLQSNFSRNVAAQEPPSVPVSNQARNQNSYTGHAINQPPQGGMQSRWKNPTLGSNTYKRTPLQQQPTAKRFNPSRNSNGCNMSGANNTMAYKHKHDGQQKQQQQQQANSLQNITNNAELQSVFRQTSLRSKGGTHLPIISGRSGTMPASIPFPSPMQDVEISPISVLDTWPLGTMTIPTPTPMSADITIHRERDNNDNLSLNFLEDIESIGITHGALSEEEALDTDTLEFPPNMLTNGDMQSQPAEGGLVSLDVGTTDVLESDTDMLQMSMLEPDMSMLQMSMLEPDAVSLAELIVPTTYNVKEHVLDTAPVNVDAGPTDPSIGTDSNNTVRKANTTAPPTMLSLERYEVFIKPELAKALYGEDDFSVDLHLIPPTILNLYNLICGQYSDYGFVYALSAQLCQESVPMECYVYMKMAMLASLNTLEIDEVRPPISLCVICHDPFMANLLLQNVGAALASRYIGPHESLLLQQLQSGLTTRHKWHVASPVLMAQQGIYYVGDWNLLSRDRTSELEKCIENGHVRMSHLQTDFPLETAIWTYWQPGLCNDEDVSFARICPIFGMPIYMDDEHDSDALRDFLLTQHNGERYQPPVDALSISNETMREFLALLQHRTITFTEKAEYLLRTYYVVSRRKRPTAFTNRTYIVVKQLAESFAKLSLRLGVLESDVVVAIFICENFMQRIFGDSDLPPPPIKYFKTISKVDPYMNSYSRWVFAYLSIPTTKPEDDDVLLQEDPDGENPFGPKRIRLDSFDSVESFQI